MRYLILLLLLASCADQPSQPPQTVYVTRTIKDCSWLPHMTASALDTPATKREIIAYETARQTNCESQK